MCDCLKQLTCNTKGGFLDALKVEFTYHSGFLSGNMLTLKQINSILKSGAADVPTTVFAEDITETVNHFKCVDLVVDNAVSPLSEELIMQLHSTLKSNASQAGLSSDPGELREVLGAYNLTENKSLEGLLDFHYRFETLHLFQDGNGRVGRLILFKECLRNNITPFIFTEGLNMNYYRALRYWPVSHMPLTDLCLSLQTTFEAVFGHVWVKANSEEEAITIALGPETPLPDGEYVSDSHQVDGDVVIKAIPVASRDMINKAAAILDVPVYWIEKHNRYLPAANAFLFEGDCRYLLLAENGEMLLSEANADYKQFLSDYAEGKRTK